MKYVIALLASSFTSAGLFEAFRAMLSGSLAPAIVPLAAGLVAWSSMVIPLVLPPVEAHVAAGPRFAWLVCAQAGPSLAIRDGLPLWRLPGGHGDLVLVVLLSIPMVAVTLVAARSLFTRAEMDAAFTRGSRNGQVAQARRTPPA
ncbi:MULTISPECIES: hypothetical protein [Methylobacterium]|uniref:Uncharacterized protein n=2 Tax=Methylobacterium TaxID=407 RepID=A0A0C6FX39_9HYPH|nr:hypothetical protein [Methylobacterium aquaticum]BAQ47820.1 hypothetical protein Maq22A_c24470 [Methylobacterium aquaticum]